jgi:hypothetical protein
MSFGEGEVEEYFLRQYTLSSHLNRENTAYTYAPLILETAIHSLFFQGTDLLVGKQASNIHKK